jgi:hypothetical protein
MSNQKKMKKLKLARFSDALVRYCSGLEERDLGDAYRKAGIAFKGQLQQNFVVLHEGCPTQDNFEKPKTGRLTQIVREENVGSPRKRLEMIPRKIN